MTPWKRIGHEPYCGERHIQISTDHGAQAILDAHNAAIRAAVDEERAACVAAALEEQYDACCACCAARARIIAAAIRARKDS